MTDFIALTRTVTIPLEEYDQLQEKIKELASNRIIVHYDFHFYDPNNRNFSGRKPEYLSIPKNEFLKKVIDERNTLRNQSEFCEIQLKLLEAKLKIEQDGMCEAKIKYDILLGKLAITENTLKNRIKMLENDIAMCRNSSTPQKGFWRKLFNL